MHILTRTCTSSFVGGSGELVGGKKSGEDERGKRERRTLPDDNKMVPGRVAVAATRLKLSADTFCYCDDVHTSAGIALPPLLLVDPGGGTTSYVPVAALVFACCRIKHIVDSVNIDRSSAR